MKAEDSLDSLINEKGRKAVLRAELLKLSNASSSSCDRVLKKKCDDGTLVRVGRGIYGIGNAKVFEIVPEVLPKLGYTIQEPQRVKGYSQKLSGRIWQLDRPCRRKIRKRGVHAVFEDSNGVRTNTTVYKRTENKPESREINDHFHDFEYCHSLARAEKNLILLRVLNVLENFRDERIELAIEGGAAIAYYYLLTHRFSENINFRIVLRKNTENLSRAEKESIVKEVGHSFATYMQDAMPYLRRTTKGRIRKDGVVQTFIFEYSPVHHHQQVQPGLKLELVHLPVFTNMDRYHSRGEKMFPAVDLLEILVGKWTALATRLPTQKSVNRDLVRHVHDLAMLYHTVTSAQTQFYRMSEEQIVRRPTIDLVMKELERDRWLEYYNDYMHRMGTTKVVNQPGYHPPWDRILNRFRRIADVLREFDQQPNVH